MTLAGLLDHNLIHLRDMALVEFLTYLLVGAAVFAMILHMRRAGAFRFLIRAPGAQTWAPVRFGTTSTGHRYLHAGGRAAPKTS